MDKTSNALKRKKENREQQDEKDRNEEEEECKNGARCRFLKTSQCWFYHPESHFSKLTPEDKNHKQSRKMVQDEYADCGRIGKTWPEKSPSADGKLATIEEEEEEYNQKNWVAGMQKSMHSLVQQVDKLTKEVIWLQKEQKTAGRK